MPKVPTKKEGSIPADLAKRPEITITPIPRSLSNLGVGVGALTPLQLADLTLNVNFNSPFAVSALQDLAKIAERYDKAAALEPSPKKHKSDEANSTRLNGASQRNNNNSALEGKRSRSDCPSPSGKSAPTLPVPDLVSADFLRQMNVLDSNSKLLLPAHQSTKTINALAALLPQTSIFPAPAPAAHQYNRTPHKPQVDSTKPEPVFQSLSVYSQSKNVYGKPTADVTKEINTKDTNTRNSSSPDIEILDLRVPSDSKNSSNGSSGGSSSSGGYASGGRVPPNSSSLASKNDRLEIELLDLSTRRDITVSAVPKPGTSKSSSSGKIPPPQVSIKTTENNNKCGPYAASSVGSSGGSKSNSSPVPGSPNQSAAALASAFAAQGIPPALASLGLGNPALLHYLMPNSIKGSSSPTQGSVPMFPYLDPATLASYYSFLPPGLLPPTSQSNSSTGGNPVAAAAAAAQLAQLNSLGLAGLPNVTPEAIASLGIYKNYLPQGNLPPPHFLSGLMSPGSSNPSNSSK